MSAYAKEGFFVHLWKNMLFFGCPLAGRKLSLLFFRHMRRNLV